MGAFIGDIAPEGSAERIRAALSAIAADRRRRKRPVPTRSHALTDAAARGFADSYGERLHRRLVRARAGQPDRRAHRLQRGLRAPVRDRRTDRRRRHAPRRRSAGAGLTPSSPSRGHPPRRLAAVGPARSPAGRRTRSAWPGRCASAHPRPGRHRQPGRASTSTSTPTVPTGSGCRRRRRWSARRPGPQRPMGPGRRPGRTSPAPASARRTTSSARRPGSWTSSRRCSASRTRRSSSTAAPIAGEIVPLPLDAAGLTIVLVDTRQQHSHATGGYADRRASCERAARVLGVRALRDVDVADLREGAARP